MTKPKDKDGDQCPGCGADLEWTQQNKWNNTWSNIYACTSYKWHGVPMDDYAQSRPCLLNQIKNLTEVVNKIPKDAEGKPCLPGDEMYHPDERPKGYVKYDDWRESDADRLEGEGVEFCYQWNAEYVKKHSPTGTPWSYRPIGECYTTKKASEAEKKRREEMEFEMRDEYDLSQGVRGKDVKDRMAKLRKRNNEK